MCIDYQVLPITPGIFLLVFSAPTPALVHTAPPALLLSGLPASILLLSSPVMMTLFLIIDDITLLIKIPQVSSTALVKWKLVCMLTRPCLIRPLPPCPDPPLHFLLTLAFRLQFRQSLNVLQTLFLPLTSETVQAGLSL